MNYSSSTFVTSAKNWMLRVKNFLNPITSVVVSNFNVKTTKESPDVKFKNLL